MEADRQEEELYDVEEAAAEDLESEPSSAARAALLASAQNVLIVLCGTCLMYKEVYTLPYPYFVQHLNSAISVVVAGLCYSAQVLLRPTALRMRFTWRFLFTAAALYSVTNLMQVVSIQQLGPSDSTLTVLLGQATIPTAAVLSYYMINKRLTLPQMCGCAVVIGGVAACVAPELSFGQQDAKSISYLLVYLASTVPQSLLMVVTEQYVAEHLPKNLHLTDTLFIMNEMQLWWNLLALPLTFGLSLAAHITDPGSFLVDDLHRGLLCLTGSTTYFAVCGDAWKHVLLFSPFTVLYNASNVVVVCYVSSTFQFVLSAVTLPPTNVLLSSTFIMGAQAGKLTSSDGYSMVAMVLGMGLYSGACNACKICKEHDSSSVLTERLKPDDEELVT